jgi:hypothetical protein
MDWINALSLADGVAGATTIELDMLKASRPFSADAIVQLDIERVPPKSRTPCKLTWEKVAAATTFGKQCEPKRMIRAHAMRVALIFDSPTYLCYRERL